MWPERPKDLFETSQSEAAKRARYAAEVYQNGTTRYLPYPNSVKLAYIVAIQDSDYVAGNWFSVRVKHLK